MEGLPPWSILAEGVGGLAVVSLRRILPIHAEQNMQGKLPARFIDVGDVQNVETEVDRVGWTAGE